MNSKKDLRNADVPVDTSSVKGIIAQQAGSTTHNMLWSENGKGLKIKIIEPSKWIRGNDNKRQSGFNNSDCWAAKSGRMP